MTPVAHFSRRYRLSASHRLHAPSLNDEQNRATFGKCNNPFGHGHNYAIEVTIAGPIDPETGFVVDMVALDALAKREVIDRWDHMNLNNDPVFSDSLVPSTENFAFEVEKIFERGVAALAEKQGSALKLVRVRIEETSNNSFDLLASRSAGGIF